LEGLGRDATVVEALDRAVGEIDASFADQPEIEAAVRATIGLTYLRLNRYEEAEPLLRRALEIRRPLLGDGHEDTVESLNGMGLLLADQGKWDESERFIREAIELARKLGEPGEDHLGDAMLNLASLAHTRGDLDEAESIYRDVLAMLLEADDEYAVAWVRHNLAGVLNDKGDYQGAESLYRDALDGFRRTRGNEHPLVASTLRGLGTVIARFNVSSETRESEGNCEAALPLFQEAIEIDDASLGPWAAAASRRSYGRCLTRLGQYERAEDPLLQAHSDLRTVYGEEDEVTVRAVESLVELYEAWGRPEKAPSTGHYWRTQRAHHQSSSKHDTPERPPLPPLRPDESTGRAPAIGQNRQLGDSK
jgi:tetratricopeptide (TPR) repeat protein